MRIPDTLLVACCPFAHPLSAERVAAAIARGVQAAGKPAPDRCPFERWEAGDELDEELAGLGFDERLRDARALVVAAWGLRRERLRESVIFALATRARQAGVPAYGIGGRWQLDAFDARMLDLQVVLEARDEQGLRAAGRELAAIA
jgi:glycerate kinase